MLTCRIAPIALVLFWAAACQAAVVTQPSGLNPGDQYRLVFVSGFGGMRDALSPDILEYNTFVAGLANGVPELNALGTTWTAIVSTAAVDARDNTNTNGIGVPIYLLDGNPVANNDADLWDGTIQNSLRVSQDGSLYFGQVWTGTQIDGTEDVGFALGEASVQAGISLQTDSLWIASGTLESDPPEDDPTNLAIYAISGILTAQATAVPEPATWTLGIAGLAALIGLAWRRRH